MQRYKIEILYANKFLFIFLCIATKIEYLCIIHFRI